MSRARAEMGQGPQELDPLLELHGPAIAALKAKIGADLPKLWDEIWLLRFILSFPDPELTEKRVRDCIRWREEKAGLIAAAREGRPAPHQEIISRYLVAGLHATASVHGEPLFVVRGGLSSPPGLMKAVGHDAVLDWFMHFKEQNLVLCDAETRARRRLVKLVSVVDLSHAQLGQYDAGFFTALSQSGKLSEVYYPQQLLRNVGVNAPGILQTVYSLVRSFMTQKMLDRQTLCPGVSAAQPSAAACPFASKRYNVATLPTFLGGACECTARGGCAGGIPNAETNAHDVAATVELRTVPPAPAVALLVGARSNHDVILGACAPGARLVWDITPEAPGLVVSAWLDRPGAPRAHLYGHIDVAAGESAGGGVALFPAHTCEPRPAPGGGGEESLRFAGEVRVPAAGTITLRLSNAHSFFYGVTVHIASARVVEPAAASASARAAAETEGGAATSAPSDTASEPGALPRDGPHASGASASK